MCKGDHEGTWSPNASAAKQSLYFVTLLHRNVDFIQESVSADGSLGFSALKRCFGEYTDNWSVNIE